MDNHKHEKLGFSRGRHRFFRKWWLRTRFVDCYSNSVEFYVPWWGWPFELAHVLIFGWVRLK